MFLSNEDETKQKAFEEIIFYRHKQNKIDLVRSKFGLLPGFLAITGNTSVMIWNITVCNTDGLYKTISMNRKA